MENRNGNFFEFLASEKLYFPVELVEDFLLSLKAKPFVILCGGSGTGKTKLAQAYGRFISTSEEGYKIANFEVTLSKSDKNRGFTLSRDEFFNNLPFDGRKGNGTYAVKIGNVESKGDIDLTPRFWFRDSNDLADEITRLKTEGNEKATLQMKIAQGKISGSNYKILPVGSNWTESRFIIGYKNVLTGKYTTTDSLDLIIKANKNPEEPFLLILDEMNLSHVERYFSDMLSAMESSEKISLDTKGDEDIPSKVYASDNLLIIGTVNMDETTYSFSPKVLDRSNVIEFDSVPVSAYLYGSGTDEKPAGDIDYLQNCMNGVFVRSKKAPEIIDEIRKSDANIAETIANDLERLQNCMKSMDLPIGLRTIDEIMRFIYAAWIYTGKGDFASFKRFFDSQIRQKILPKIHGGQEIMDGLKSMNTVCVESGYEKSAERIKKMVSTLEKQRYVSFN